MQKKRAYLVSFIIASMSFGQAMAQSSHDAARAHEDAVRAHEDRARAHEIEMRHNGHDRFEIASHDGLYRVGIRGLLQENNIFTKKGTQNKFKMELNRARLSLYGSVLDPRLTFMVQTALEHQEETRIDNKYYAPGTDYLSDYYFNFAFHQHHFHLRAGKFGVPFSRQQMMPAARMQFYDTSMANKHFRITNTGKDVGIMAHNSLDNRYEWAVALVNNGVVGRVGYNHHHIDGYDMVDWHGGEIRFAVAANGFVSSDYKSLKVADLRGGIDFIAKVAHFAANGAFFYQWDKRVGNDAQNNVGTGLDLGYLIIDRWEPVLRHSWVKQGDRHAHEVLGGLNYYIHGHNLKLQAYGGVDIAEKEINRGLGGVQVQLAI